MTKRRKQYKTYTKEFKQEAVRLMVASDKMATEIVRELGIRSNQLYKWKDQLQEKGDQAFAGAGRPRKAAQCELAQINETGSL